MTNRKVYILADGGHDYGDAERFGTLVKLEIPAAAKWDIARLFEELKMGLNMAQEDDYIVISHLASHVAVATAIMVEWYGRVNFLIFRMDKYEVGTLITSNLNETSV